MKVWLLVQVQVVVSIVIGGGMEAGSSWVMNGGDSGGAGGSTECSDVERA